MMFKVVLLQEQKRKELSDLLQFVGNLAIMVKMKVITYEQALQMLKNETKGNKEVENVLKKVLDDELKEEGY